MAFSLPNFSSFFEKAPKSVIGVDVGSSSIKVVQLRREKGRAVLETYGAIALGPYGGLEIGRATALPTEKITEALKDVVREANVTTLEAGFSIPYSSSLVSVLKLPAAVERNLNQAVPLEAQGPPRAQPLRLEAKHLDQVFFVSPHIRNRRPFFICFPMYNE